jgi:hypothetical protein
MLSRIGTRGKGANVEHMPLGNRSRRKDILQPFRIFYSLAQPCRHPLLSWYRASRRERSRWWAASSGWRRRRVGWWKGFRAIAPLLWPRGRGRGVPSIALQRIWGNPSNTRATTVKHLPRGDGALAAGPSDAGTPGRLRAPHRTVWDVTESTFHRV